MTTKGAAILILSNTLLLAAPHAQRNQPIYPVYDGFVKNPDGSYTVAFGYFSHNADVVTVPAGAENGFAPEPGDRQQPITFKPGHWRFQCVMVVNPDVAGRVRWTLTYAGTTTGTSERMLQSNWNLVEGAAELGRIEFGKVPRGVCLNRAPVVRILGKTARKGEVSIDARTSEDLHLFGSVQDEGLPRGRELSIAWKVLKGAGTVTFSNPNAARTRAAFTAPGTYELELSATDSELSSVLRVIVKVA